MNQQQQSWRRTPPSPASASSSGAASPLSDEQNTKLLQMALCAVAGVIILKVLVTALFGLSLLLVPLLLYAAQTCPSDDSFDAKKEIKRVLRGVHLPENHPDKPKTWLAKTVAKVQASVVTEASTAFGYEVTLTKMWVFATVVCAHVPVARVDCYWIGIFGKWRYVTMRAIQQDPASASASYHAKVD